MFTNLPFRLLLTCICIGFILPVSGQTYFNKTSAFLKANGIWTFGDSTGLNFNIGGPTPFMTGMLTDESSAAISDPVTGQLLFYTNGIDCWDAANQLMSNGSSLMSTINSNTTTMQGACIVPVIDTPGKYYIFSLNFIGLAPALFYSVVDMSLNGGMGDIEPARKAILLNSTAMSEGMIAIPGDNCDIWLLLHRFPEAEFIAYHITSAGLNTTPVVSITGLPALRQSGIAVSSDRSMVAISNTKIGRVPPNPGLQVAQFDPATGVVSNAMRIDSNSTYGLCFSPDNSKLYSSYQASQPLSTFQINQYDLSVFNAAAIASSSTIIYSETNLPNSPYLKLYNDTIYVGNAFGNALSRINKPNLSGIACDYQDAAVSLISSDNPDARVIFGLCNAVVFPMPPDTARFLSLDTTLCTQQQNGLSLTLQAPPGYSGYIWDDNSDGSTRTVTAAGAYWVLGKDPCHLRMDTFIVREKNVSFSLGSDTSVCENTSSLLLDVPLSGVTFQWQDGSTLESYTATGPGTYWVTVTDSGCAASDTIQVGLASFQQNLGADTMLCREQPVSLKLEANAPPGSTTLWSTGSNAPSIIIRDTGDYWVSVINNGCTGSDTLHVATEICDCIFIMPTAFSPNGDGLNDVLKPGIAPGCAVSHYMLSVYNRYGQRVFFSTDPDKGWDGKFRGQPQDVGTYFFELRFNGGKKQSPYYQKGDATLIR